MICPPFFSDFLLTVINTGRSMWAIHAQNLIREWLNILPPFSLAVIQSIKPLLSSYSLETKPADFLPATGHALLWIPITFYAKGPVLTNLGGLIWVDFAMVVFHFSDLKKSIQMGLSTPLKLCPSSHGTGQRSKASMENDAHLKDSYPLAPMLAWAKTCFLTIMFSSWFL